MKQDDLGWILNKAVPTASLVLLSEIKEFLQ